MPSYRIYRLKAHLRQSFRTAPHVAGTANVKPRDYDMEDESAAFFDAPTPYAAYFAMKDSEAPLEPGDLLDSGGKLRIYKYVGFEEAQWVLPEPKPIDASAGEANSEPVLAINASS
jgi:hypothetical protein